MTEKKQVLAIKKKLSRWISSPGWIWPEKLEIKDLVGKEIDPRVSDIKQKIRKLDSLAGVLPERLNKKRQDLNLFAYRLEKIAGVLKELLSMPRASKNMIEKVLSFLKMIHDKIPDFPKFEQTVDELIQRKRHYFAMSLSRAEADKTFRRLVLESRKGKPGAEARLKEFLKNFLTKHSIPSQLDSLLDFFVRKFVREGYCERGREISFSDRKLDFYAIVRPAYDKVHNYQHYSFGDGIFFSKQGDRHYFLISDATEHSVLPCLVEVWVIHLVKDLIRYNKNLRQITSILDSQISKMFGDKQMPTLLLGVIEKDEVRIVSLGTEAHLSHDGMSWKTISASTGGLLGVLFEELRHTKIKLYRGSILVAFTDGITERKGINKKVLLSLFDNTSPLKRLSDRALGYYSRFAQDAPEGDDSSMLVLRLK
jgi:hypothetical protein